MEEQCTIAVLNHEGDTKYSWNPKNPAEVEAAREHFESLKRKGFLAFRVKIFGRRGTETTTFDENAGRYIYEAPKTVEEAEPEAVLERTFDPEASYVVTPQMAGG